MVPGARVGRLDHRTPYSIRHTFASFAIAAGVSLFYLARLMGSSVDQIDKTYGHLLPEARTTCAGFSTTFDNGASHSRRIDDQGMGAARPATPRRLPRGGDRFPAQLAQRPRPRHQLDHRVARVDSRAKRLVYRYLAADESCTAAVASLQTSTAPSQPERYEQERDLFGFFFHGYSCIECLDDGLYSSDRAVPIVFDPGVNRQSVTPPNVAAAYRTAYATEPITAQLGTVESSDCSWRRNILSHRGAPGRVVTLGAGHDDPIDWKLPVSDVQTTILDAAGLIRRRSGSASLSPRSQFGRALRADAPAVIAFGPLARGSRPRNRL